MITTCVKQKSNVIGCPDDNASTAQTYTLQLGTFEGLCNDVMPMKLVFKSSHRLFADDCRLEKLQVVSTGPLAKHLHTVTTEKSQKLYMQHMLLFWEAYKDFKINYRTFMDNYTTCKVNNDVHSW